MLSEPVQYQGNGSFFKLGISQNTGKFKLGRFLLRESKLHSYRAIELLIEC